MLKVSHIYRVKEEWSVGNRDPRQRMFPFFVLIRMDEKVAPLRRTHFYTGYRYSVTGGRLHFHFANCASYRLVCDDHAVADPSAF